MSVHGNLFMSGFVVLTCALSASAQEENAKPNYPTLDDAVYISAQTDKTDVYLGEPVRLTLEYWELQFRGMRVQPHYNVAQPRLPDTEGFFATAPESSTRSAERGGEPYTVTTYHAWLYPARAGTLRLGAWSWSGTVRGHTAAGAQSRTVDLNTKPISIRVRPLPDPPSTFEGAVGELAMELEFGSREWVRGEPVTALITLSGTGNPHAAKLPALPAEPWFSTGDPVAEDVEASPSGAATFSRRYRVVVMPLGGGEHRFPPLSLTYFSPSEGRYKVARTAPVPVSISGDGPADTLVVIGGGNGRPGPPMETMDDGRLPIVSSLDHAEPGRRSAQFGMLWMGLPPVAFLIVFLTTFDRRAWRQRFRRPARRTSDDERLAATEQHARPIDALNAVIRDILSERTGRDTASMSIPEVGECVGELAPESTSDAIVSVLRECETLRYGQGEASCAELIERVQNALRGVPGARQAGRRWW